MDLLGAYTDSDEESNAVVAAVAPVKVNASANAQSSTTNSTTTAKAKNAGTKRKKKLDMSFLPPNIIEALARGDTLNDSDSDDEKKPHKLPTTTISSSSSSALLSKLPKPKNIYEAPGKSESSVMRVDISAPSYREDSDEDEIPGPSFPSHSEAFSSYPDPDPDTHDQEEVPIVPVATYRGINTAPVVEPELTLPRPGNLEARYTHPIAAPQHTKPKPNAHQSRKRDREIQQELLRGNVSAVEFAGYVDVANPSEWDDRVYREQAQRQKELQTMFNFGQNAGEKQIAQPSKVQNKKHQINSLALSAAQMELELMDARDSRLQSKAHTQAKYGW